MNSNFAHKLSGLALALLATLALPVYAQSAATSWASSAATSAADSQSSTEADDSLMGGVGPYTPSNPTLWGNNNWGLRDIYSEVGSYYVQPAAVPSSSGMQPFYGDSGGISVYGVIPNYSMQTHARIMPKASTTKTNRGQMK